jgi:peptidoglycan/xylan/chitin deacetylase (PgdA/CDA1 family)
MKIKKLKITYKYYLFLISTNLKQILKEIFYFVASLPLINKFAIPRRGRACVLFYHRILPDDEFNDRESPNSSLVVTVSQFENQMEYLSKNYDVVSMDALSEHIENDGKGYVVAVTFDDGYKDNLLHALPILEKFKIPATIYITTRFPEGDTWMWWFEVWDHLNTAKNENEDIDEQNSVIKKAAMMHKILRFNSLRIKILKLNSDDLNTFISSLTKSSIRKQFEPLCLNWQEIIDLDSNPLITIGAHTHSHLNLRKLKSGDAYNEIFKSKMLLEAKLGHTIDYFAYPYGTSNEASVREYKMALECGFRLCVTTLTTNNLTHDLMATPRLGISCLTSMNRFKCVLSGWDAIAQRGTTLLKNYFIEV